MQTPQGISLIFAKWSRSLLLGLLFTFVSHYLGMVSFLGHPHRHVFHFRVAIQVFHDDREIEFIQFKRWLQSLVKSELDYKSCEMISDDLYDAIAARYPGREVRIEVSEDGENGSTCEYSPTTNAE